MQWMKQSFRRHLMDMHINDWEDGRFLSEFSPEDYCENLKRGHVKSAMIYLQSHAGYCHYPTKVGHTHSAFKKNPYAMKRLIDLCHEAEIDVIGYYSLNHNTLESRVHKDWTAVEQVLEGKEPFGEGRYAICCPNNPDYFNFILEQIKEMIEYADMEGMFFDMPYWPYTCYCEHCRKKYFEATGKEIPNQGEEADWKPFLKLREKWTDDYVGAITRYVKSINPNLSVQFNYAFAVRNSVGCLGSEVINSHNDYASGDIYRDHYTQAFACKFFSAITRNKPFEYMTGRCDPGLNEHTITKSDDKLRLSVMLTVAHHGACFMIDGIDPMGTIDSRFYDRLGKLYAEVEKYEPYLNVGEPIEDIGLFYIIEARNFVDGDKSDHYNSVLNCAKILSANHVPYGIVTQATLKNRMNNFKAIMIPKPKNLTEETIDLLKKYVEEGGIVYFSGADDEVMLKEFLGTEILYTADYNYTYMAPQEGYEEIFEDFTAKYPVSGNNPMPIVKEIDDAEILAKAVLPYIHPTEKTKFSSIHSSPPGTYLDNPTVVVKTIGKGKVIWSAHNIEARIMLSYQKILLELLSYAGVGEYQISSTADTATEIVAFKSDKEVLVSAVYGTTDEKSSIRPPFQITVRCEKPKKVVLLRNFAEIPFEYQDGSVTFTTVDLDIFDMYRIEL